MTIQAFSEFINATMGIYPLLLVVEILAITIKGWLLYALCNRPVTRKAKISYFLIIIILIATTIEDVAWLAKAVQALFIPSISYAFLTVIIRTAWFFSGIQTLALGLFLESLVIVPLRFTWHHIVRLALVCASSAGFAWFMVSNFFVQTTLDKTVEEYQLMSLTAHYGLFVLLLPSVLMVLYHLRTKSLPRILKVQTNALIKLLILPRFVLEGIQALFSHYSPTFTVTSFTIVNVSTILTTYLLYVTARKIMSIRFLNFHASVRQNHTINTTQVLKEALDQLSNVTSLNELEHLTKSFFKNIVHIPLGRTSLFLISTQKIVTGTQESHLSNTVERFINQQEQHRDALAYLQKNKILIYDDIAFSQLYDEQDTLSCLLNFMHDINADLFIPIYDHTHTLGYIVVERDARTNALYNDLERDEIIVFTQFVAHVAVLLQNRTLETLLENKKRLKEELMHKHKEMQQCKESIRSFLGDHAHKKIGVVFYKNRSFVFGNQSAKELIDINPNLQEGHPIARDLKQVVHAAQSYKTTQTLMSRDNKGNRLILNAIPNLEAQNIIIVIHSPDISDIVYQQLHHLNDPSDWDYLLFLQTTASGKLINQLIPGSHKTLLNLKVNILKRALSEKPLLICLPDEDAQTIVEILHAISLRETLHTIDLDVTTPDSLVGITIFGLNPLFGSSLQRPLLETLDHNGSLFIKQIQRLDRLAQNHLAYFLRYGVYQPYRSEQKLHSKTRIICSTHHSPATLTQSNKLTPELMEILNENILELPSLLTLNEDALGNLAQEYASQSIETEELRGLLALTDKDKLKLIHKKAISLHEFKRNVQQFMQLKGKKHHVVQPTLIEPTGVLDPELLNAARLGKHALRDPKTMALLWNKFKNQNKIATFLKVNRSSINRRCKQYHLN